MEKTEFKIRIVGDSVLRKRSALVETVTDEHRAVLSAMARIMYQSSGIGLAAPQVGINQTMIVVDIGSGLFKMINPKIVKRSGRQAIEEGCLSIPGICIKVKRAEKITVEAWDENGKAFIIEASGLLACVFQHEIDHLKGKLIIDYATLLDKLKISNRVEALKRKGRSQPGMQAQEKYCKLQL